MKVSAFGSDHSPETRARFHPMKVLASTGAVALFAALLAVGGSATASVAVSRASASRFPIVAVATAAAPKYYLQQSGTGSKNLRAVALPAKWYLVWKFNCGAKKESFSLTSTKQGQSALAVARQTGARRWRSAAVHQGGHLQVRHQDDLRLATERSVQAARCEVGSQRQGRSRKRQ